MLVVTVRDIRHILHEAARDEYVVRGGRELLSRGVDESPKDWRWVRVDKVTYFSEDELVSKPRSLTDRQVWVFKRGDRLFAVDERDFFSRPT